MSDLIAVPDLSVFLTREAKKAGLNDRAIAGLVRTGQWHRLRRGAFVDGAVWRDADESRRHALLARAVLRQADVPLVLSHVSALPEYALPMWGLRRDEVHVTRRDARSGRAERGIRQHRGRLLADDVREVGDVEVTAPARTALDITTIASTEVALVLVNALLHARLSTLADLWARYDTMQMHPHTLRTQLVLRLADPRVESVGETRTVYVCWRHGIPAPVPQWEVLDEHGRVIARLDLAWPELGCWLEFDGRSKYLRSARPGETVADVVLREKRREDRVRELTGWRCLRITWADLADPASLAARITAFLRRAVAS